MTIEVPSLTVVVPEEFRYLYVTNQERPVLKVPAPVLRQKATEVDRVTKRTQFLVDDLVRIMRKANGVGLAAPQVGILQRVVVVQPEGMRPTALINPRLLMSEGEELGEEGCLSLPGLYGDVPRAAYVEVEALDRKGREIVLELEGMPARVVQHELDHLEGVLFTDKVVPESLHWMDPEQTDAPVE